MHYFFMEKKNEKKKNSENEAMELLADLIWKILLTIKETKKNEPRKKL